jgi:hypothetical protein
MVAGFQEQSWKLSFQLQGTHHLLYTLLVKASHYTSPDPSRFLPSICAMAYECWKERNGWWLFGCHWSQLFLSATQMGRDHFWKNCQLELVAVRWPATVKIMEAFWLGWLTEVISWIQYVDQNSYPKPTQNYPCLLKKNLSVWWNIDWYIVTIGVL